MKTFIYYAFIFSIMGFFHAYFRNQLFNLLAHIVSPIGKKLINNQSGSEENKNDNDNKKDKYLKAEDEEYFVLTMFWFWFLYDAFLIISLMTLIFIETLCFPFKIVSKTILAFLK